jgi:hypothetical protein
MAFGKRHEIDPPPIIDTNVWACTSPDCNGWMRAAFSLEETPTCPLCIEEMKAEVRQLPEIVNNNKYS